MHSNARAVLSGFQAFAEGDMAAMKGVLADDVTWHVAGRNKWSGDYSGPGAVVQYLSGVSAEATIETRPHAVLAADSQKPGLLARVSERGWPHPSADPDRDVIGPASGKRPFRSTPETQRDP